MKKSTSKNKKSKLSLEELKKKGKTQNESMEALSGGILGAGPGAATTSARSYDGDKQPK
jgi:hypothetical protein